jgi:hypothetical protein
MGAITGGIGGDNWKDSRREERNDILDTLMGVSEVQLHNLRRGSGLMLSECDLAM